MRITYDPSVDAAMVICREGQYDRTIGSEVEGVTLNVDLDAEGNVLGLEILGANDLFALIERRGGELSLPDRIEDVKAFNIETCFQIDE